MNISIVNTNVHLFLIILCQISNPFIFNSSREAYLTVRGESHKIGLVRVITNPISIDLFGMKRVNLNYTRCYM